MTDCQGRERTGLVYIYFHWEVSSLSARTLQAMETTFPKIFVLMPLSFSPNNLMSFYNIFLFSFKRTFKKLSSSMCIITFENIPCPLG